MATPFRLLLSVPLLAGIFFAACSSNTSAPKAAQSATETVAPAAAPLSTTTTAASSASATVEALTVTPTPVPSPTPAPPTPTVVVATATATPSPTPAANAPVGDAVKVTIAGAAYLPETLTVKAGTTITWTNTDNPGNHGATDKACLAASAHCKTGVVNDDGSFDTGIFGQGESKSLTLTKPGTYTYTCTLHPFMQGTVIVQ